MFFVLLTGVFTAAHDLKTEWVVIKGISGYADSSASLTEDWIPFASAMAASLVNKMLSEPMVFEQWPHYQSRDTNTSEGTNRSGGMGGGLSYQSERGGDARRQIKISNDVTDKVGYSHG